jgi:hypothetical protein
MRIPLSVIKHKPFERRGLEHAPHLQTYYSWFLSQNSEWCTYDVMICPRSIHLFRVYETSKHFSDLSDKGVPNPHATKWGKSVAAAILFNVRCDPKLSRQLGVFLYALAFCS